MENPSCIQITCTSSNLDKTPAKFQKDTGDILGAYMLR